MVRQPGLPFTIFGTRASVAKNFGNNSGHLVQVLHKDLAEDTTAHLARVGALFDKPQFSDVRVVAADGCGFYCHRAVLAACSKPFERAMLTEGMCRPSDLPSTCSWYASVWTEYAGICRYATYSQCIGSSTQGHLLRYLASSAPILLHCGVPLDARQRATNLCLS